MFYSKFHRLFPCFLNKKIDQPRINAHLQQEQSMLLQLIPLRKYLLSQHDSLRMLLDLKFFLIFTVTVSLLSPVLSVTNMLIGSQF